MTQRLFLDDPTLASTSATVVASGPDGIVLDRTVFYARGGGQPGDSGALRWDGGETPITEAVKGEGEAILHLFRPDAALPPVGTVVKAAIDWQRRHAHDADAHRDASAVQPDQGRRGDRRIGWRGQVPAGLRPAQPAAEGGQSRPA